MALKDRIPALLESYRGEKIGWYRLCNSGCLVTPGPRSGLGFSCLAAKVTMQCGIWEHLEPDYRTEWINYIRSFQLPAGPPDFGMFSDPDIEHRAFLRYTMVSIRRGKILRAFRPNWQNRWAETRQAMSVLLAAGTKPTFEVGGFPDTPSAIETFLNELNWQNPWESGAQAGHLLFFLKHGNLSAPISEANKSVVLDFLRSIERPTTGGWYRGSVANQEIINGAMKIISGLVWWQNQIPNAEKLAVTATADVDDAHDCALANRLFVLYQLKQDLGSLPNKSKDIAELSLDHIQKFIQSDGGLSGGKTGSLPYYYFAHVSRGQRVGDLHGLTLLTWAATLAAHILGLQRELDWHPVAP
jgi:hypothetical protein